MAQIAFPTRPGPIGVGQSAGRTGEPDEAKPCRGHHTVICEDTCLFCGRLPMVTIRRTFEQRARAVVRW